MRISRRGMIDGPLCVVRLRITRMQSQGRQVCPFLLHCVPHGCQPSIVALLTFLLTHCMDYEDVDSFTEANVDRDV